MKIKFDSNHSPLTSTIFYILFSLRNGKKYGYTLLNQIEIDSKGAVKLRSGTLYTCLRSMLKNGLIELAQDSNEVGVVKIPRKYYQLTKKGKDFLFHEISRFHEIIKSFYQGDIANELEE